MSTNKTENYGLHAWVAGDDFLREEMNENFSLLDRSACIVTGSYTGDGSTSREIVLGSRPKAVLVESSLGCRSTSGYFAGGLLSSGKLTEQGFLVNHQNGNNANNLGTDYLYWALF